MSAAVTGGKRETGDGGNVPNPESTNVMSVKITPEIRQALRRLIDDWGSALEVERRTRIANSTISRYLSGRLTRMNSTTWSVLAPHLTPLMTQPEDPPKALPPLPPPRSIFAKILYDDGISDEERVKFLRLLVEPEEPR